MEPIILASASPRRKQLLDQIKIPYTVIPSDVDEDIDRGNMHPSEFAKRLAYIKAEAISKSHKGIVLGADTIVVIDNEILGKPKSDKDAFEMLSKLSGRVHEVITAIAILEPDKGISKVEHEVTKVTFRKLNKKMIDHYIKSGEHNGKAGSYAIQGLGVLFVEEIFGCYTNIVGLPLPKLVSMMEEIGIEIM